jgi:hypothetical protein
MRAKYLIYVMPLLLISSVAFVALAQPPRGRGPGGPGGRRPGESSGARTLEAFVAKWLTMDENQDGKLSKEELKDRRLANLFKESDKNADGILDIDEMKLLFESSNKVQSGRKEGGPGGRSGRPPPPPDR